MAFKAVNYILFEKDKKELDFSVLEKFSSYLVRRYFSFYDSSYVLYINDTINKSYSFFRTKEDEFKFYDNLIPKLKKRPIKYVKRPKKSVEKDNYIIPEFCSKREIDKMKQLSKYLHGTTSS